MDIKPLQVYFDWNIIAYYRDVLLKKSSQFTQQFEQLEQLLNSNEIVTYYSDAHIIDLLPINKTDYNDDFYKNDLAAITKLTNNKYLQFDYFKNYWAFIRLQPETQMAHLKSTHFDTMDYGEQFNLMGIIGDSLKMLFKAIPSPMPDSIDYKPENNNSLYDVMDFFASENNKSLQDSNNFRNRKKKFFEGMIKDSEIKKIKSDLDKGNFNEFTKYYNKLSSIVGNVLNNRFAEVHFIFNLLDQLYYASDKKLRNINVDSQHTTYASHSKTKYFVSEDKNLRKKAMIAYKILNIPIQCLSLNKFLEIFANKKI